MKLLGKSVVSNHQHGTAPLTLSDQWTRSLVHYKDRRLFFVRLDAARNAIIAIASSSNFWPSIQLGFTVFQQDGTMPPLAIARRCCGNVEMKTHDGHGRPFIGKEC